MSDDAPTPSAGDDWAVTPLTHRTLDALPRRARSRAMWGAMSPAAREQAWARLSPEQRAEAIAVMFDCAVEEASG